MPFEDDLIEVVTPERVELNFPVAGLGSRFTAAILDSIFLNAANFVIIVIISYFMFEPFSGNDYLLSVVRAVAIVVIFVVNFGYFIFFEYFGNGQTPGKRIMKIRVIRYGGLPLDFASAVIRNLFRAVDIILFAMAVGFLIIFLSKQSQRTGDFVAGTVVIHDRNVSLNDLDKYLRKAYTPAQVVDRTIIGRFRKLSDEDAHLIELFMEKRQEMTLDARREFAGQIASGIRTKLNLKSDEYGRNENLIRVAREALHAMEKGNW